MSGPLPPPPLQSDRSEWIHNHAIDVDAVRIKEGSRAAGIGACERAILATISLAASATCFGKASRTATIIGVYINGGSEKAEKLG